MRSTSQQRGSMSTPLSIAIFYGSTTCYTEMAAEKIQNNLKEALNASVALFDIKDTSLQKSEQYDVVLYGISTWDFGELQEDWASCWSDIAGVDLSGKTIALFGLGDQYGYPDWFQDALGMLHNEIVTQACEIIGYWPNVGYEFNESKAVTEDNEFFVGLPLDDENQFELTDERIKTWCDELLDHFKDEEMLFG